jgi:outer membrane protein insertion porin family
MGRDKLKGKCLFLFMFVFANVFCMDAFASDVPVKEAHVEGLYSIGEKELLYLLEIKEGKAITPSGIRRGIKRAFLKGIFDYISVERDDGDKSVIRVRVKERDVIEDVKIEGNRVLSKGFIRESLILKKRGFMRYDLIEEASAALSRAMNEKGFPDGRVKIATERKKEPYRVNVLVDVYEGEPLYIRDINIVGRPGDEVLGVMRLGSGDVFDQFRLKEEMERLKNHYRKSGYPNPMVGPYTYSDGTLDIGVSPGKRLKVGFTGNSVASSKELDAMMPFFEAEDIRDDLTEEAVARMVSFYHGKGYPFVQIAPIMSMEGDDIKLSFYIFEGKKVEVGKILFKGNSIPEGNLKAIMSLKEGGVYNPDALDGNMTGIAEFYNALGYLNVSVQEPEVRMADSTAGISIEVKEGERFVISGVEVNGVDSVPMDGITKAINIRAGSPYNEVDIFDARYRALELYAEAGFAECRVDIKRQFDGSSVKVIFDISEGALSAFGKTVIIGNRNTRSKVIERELIHNEGMPFKYKLLARERQRLYELGLFTSVDVEAARKYDDEVDVSVRVNEGKSGAFEFGAGYGDYEGPRGFMDVGYRNLFGLNRQGSVRIELSSLEKRYAVNYTEPWFLDMPMQMRALLLREERREKNIDTGETRYRLERHSASAGIEKTLSKKVKAELFYEFSFVKTFDVKPDVILSKEDTGTLAISGIRPGIVYDTRDNPFDPKKGLFAGVSAKLASLAFLSETDFIKVIVHGSAYKGLGKRFVLAASVRAGGALGFADTDELPIVERFFLGGRSTERGYEQDTLGPKGSEGTPVGGNAFLLLNMELRTSIGKGFGIVAFLDGGNVWRKIEEFDPSDLKYTTGLGIRYNTPVGPLRVDYGHKLDREAGESAGEVHFSIGHAF